RRHAYFVGNRKLRRLLAVITHGPHRIVPTRNYMDSVGQTRQVKRTAHTERGKRIMRARVLLYRAGDQISLLVFVNLHPFSILFHSIRCDYALRLRPTSVGLTNEQCPTLAFPARPTTINGAEQTVGL